jgi:hypothetical protein
MIDILKIKEQLMLNKFKKWFTSEPETPPPVDIPPVAVVKEKKPRKPRPQKVEPPPPTAKETATLNNQPYINILKVEIDPTDINNGSFELDWNDKFLLNLIKAGYKMRDDDADTVIVDRWFQTVCRNIALEIYEQNQADPDNRDVRVIRSRDLGNGRTEVS